MAELRTKEAIVERITALQHDLDTLVMSAEKQYRTRFEVSDPKYTLLRIEIDELRKMVDRTVGTQRERAEKHEQVAETRTERKTRWKQRNRRTNELQRNGLQKQIEHLEFRLQKEVYSPKKVRDLINTIAHLKQQKADIEEENPAYYRKNS